MTGATREHAIVTAEQIRWRGEVANPSPEESVDWLRFVDARSRLEAGHTLEVVSPSTRTMLGSWWTFSRVLPFAIAFVVVIVWSLRLLGVRSELLPAVVAVGVLGCSVPIMRRTWTMAKNVRVSLAPDEIRVVGAFVSKSFEPASVRAIERATLVSNGRGSSIDTYALAVRGRRRLVRLAAAHDDASSRAIPRRATPQQLTVLAWADLHGVNIRTGQLPRPPVPEGALSDVSVRLRADGAIERVIRDDRVALHVDARFIQQPAIADHEILSARMIDERIALIASLPLAASLRVGDRVRVVETATGLIVDDLIAPSSRAVLQVKMHDRLTILEWRPVVEALGVTVQVSPYPRVVRLDVPDVDTAAAVRSALRPWIEKQGLMLTVIAEPGPGERESPHERSDGAL